MRMYCGHRKQQHTPRRDLGVSVEGQTAVTSHFHFISTLSKVTAKTLEAQKVSLMDCCNKCYGL